MASASRGTPAPVEDGVTPLPGEALAAPTPASLPALRALASEARVIPRREPAGPGRPRTVEELLLADATGFNFFQTVRLLERLFADRRPVGRQARPGSEVVRFRAHQSLEFPASANYELQAARPDRPPLLTVRFMGLTGPSGVMPRHYTELLLRLERESRHLEKYAFREWLDLFNHRLISLFYRAWEKYRFYVPYERGEYASPEPDPFTRALFSLIGLEVPQLRGRLHVATWERAEDEERERTLAQVDDLSLLYYSGFLANRTRCAVSLEALLRDYFELPACVQQFTGQWLYLDPANQSQLNGVGSNNELGLNLVVGERVWDAQSKFRVRLGPLGYDDFVRFLPDRAPVTDRKAFFLLVHLVRLYVGGELDFDVQLILKAQEVPPCHLADGGVGPRLGWNTWLISRPPGHDAEEAAFEAEEVVLLN